LDDMREYSQSPTFERRSERLADLVADAVAMVRENLKAGREIVPHLPLLERLVVGYPAPLWCAIASRWRPVALGLEFIWRHTASPTR